MICLIKKDTGSKLCIRKLRLVTDDGGDCSFSSIHMNFVEPQDVPKRFNSQFYVDKPYTQITLESRTGNPSSKKSPSRRYLFVENCY